MQTHTKSNGYSRDSALSAQDLQPPYLNNTQSHESSHQPLIPPSLSFEKTAFSQLLSQYDKRHDLPPTLELTQAFLMTQNLNETACRVNGGGSGGSHYYLKNDYVGECSKFVDQMQIVNRLVGNLGTSDKASNFLLEKRNLEKAQSIENKAIRDLISSNVITLLLISEQVVDGLEAVRIKEKIAQTKSRVQHLLDEKFTSDEEEEKADTQEDSETAMKSKEEQRQRIKAVIKQIRKEASLYLKKDLGGKSRDLPIGKLWKLLGRNEKFMRKRDSKAYSKGLLQTVQSAQRQLVDELSRIEERTRGIKKSKGELKREIQIYEQVNGLEKRLKNDIIGKSVSEIDQQQMTTKSYELQRVLFNFCDVSSRRKGNLFGKKEIFGRIKKLPQKSSLLQCYQDQGENKGSFINGEGSLTNQARKKNMELVKIIGLEPEKFFTNVDKYRICIDKMPVFSNVFERAEPLIPGLGMTVAGQLMVGSGSGQMQFARVDGRNVISLQFNPYELEDPNKKKVYDNAVKELVEQREKIKSVSKQAKEKQEQSNIKRAWLNIVKKDIPKAHKGYQKYKADLDLNTKKQVQNCLKEVRKKALKTQKLQKEGVVRAKKLTKDMMNFWKKRDKELADLKRKKEKFEKEIRRKQEEEKEMQLQKKRLEFIMQQSEIYAHFMSKKLGLHEQQVMQIQDDLACEKGDNIVRPEVNNQEVIANVTQIINTTYDKMKGFDKGMNGKKPKLISGQDLQIDNFDNADTTHSSNIEAPKCFKGTMKDYQLKGLRWLDNLYEQGINGILADEMGLGKTIQAISLLAHIYESKGDYGPFLIIVPVTTLHNWQNELAKFCPSLKVLPYFGSPEERKKLGRFLDQKSQDQKNSVHSKMQFNVLLTSYNLIVNNQKDQQKLLRIEWRYMILDEAQAIKNNLSRRWRILLQFNARNRLLLTGTPIQNTMAELWALLHFIMPGLFDSHEQFQEWFSKDIEQNSSNQGDINKHQLKRLHLVLKPFMLRRLKKDVESEIGPKIEHEMYCEMTHRQRVLYQRIKNKISTKDLFQLVDSKQKMENLMNLVMQFRKVCNHPELFERRVGRIPFSFRNLQLGVSANPYHSALPDIRASMRNPIEFEIPKLVYDECFMVSDNMLKTYRKQIKYEDVSMCEMSVENHFRFFNIFNSYNLYQEGFKSNSGFGILQLLMKSNNWSVSEMSYLFVADCLIKQVALMHYYSQKQERKIYFNVHNNENKIIELNYNSTGAANQSIDIVVSDFVKRDESQQMYRNMKIQSSNGRIEVMPALIPSSVNNFTQYSLNLLDDLDVYVCNTQAETIQIGCRSSAFNRFKSSISNNAMLKKVLLGKDFKPKVEIYQGRTGRDKTSFLTEDPGNSYKNGPPRGYELFEKGIIGELLHEKGSSLMELPNYSRLVSDCSKMKFLDKLLMQLHKDKHRVLIFCQMTKMLDILEDFLSWRKYTYFRMDGSTTIPDRRYMVEEYQKNKDIFAFLLSTRAGGLGVNLTGADTVIFYDNDWNPTMDAQATDRAHRIGQTKQVLVYRIVTKGTVEEKIVKRAKQKQNVQSTVYGGNNLKADVFRPKDMVDMLLDEEEQEDLKDKSAKFLKTKRIKRKLMHDEEEKKRVTSPLKKSEGKKVKKEKKEEKKNIFCTSKDDVGKNKNAFSIFSVSKAETKQEEQVVNDEEEEDEDEKMSENEEYGEEEEEEEEEGVEFDCDGDDEVKGKSKGKQVMDEDEDDEMVDEY